MNEGRNEQRRNEDSWHEGMSILANEGKQNMLIDDDDDEDNDAYDERIPRIYIGFNFLTISSVQFNSGLDTCVVILRLPIN